MPAPSSYVPGLGRGASGFTTRSDIGPAREAPSKETIEAAQIRRGELTDDEAFQDPETENGLFSGIEYDADDDAADEIFDKIDREMGIQEIDPKEPKIQIQFMDLKRALSSVTDEEWGKIPEVSNLTKRRKVKETRSYAIPDSILVDDRNKFRLEMSLSDEQQFTADESDIIGLSTARESILSLKLDQASASTSAVNPTEYLAELDNTVARTETEIGNIKKARLPFDSMVNSNPKYAQGWIAAAGVEEHAGNMVAARKLINAGCLQCPNNEEIWLEAVRLHDTHDARVILANAVQHIQQSPKIWLKAAELEAGTDGKRRVLRKALESIPTSVRLWKEAINLETSASEARLLLARAVELVPQSVELWLALARLQPFEQAKSVLNAAGNANPMSVELRIAAAHLLESTGACAETIDNTIAASVQKLRSRGVHYMREKWLADAERSDELGMPQTCGAIVKATISMDVDPDDQVTTWLGDIEMALSRNRATTARVIAAYMVKVFPERADVWEKAIEIENQSNANSSKNVFLEQAVARCPTAERLWLMLAKQKQSDGDVPAARKVLEQALGTNSNSQRIWLAAVELEVESGEMKVARSLLALARDAVNTEQLWMKSAVFERLQGNFDQALSITDAALTRDKSTTDLAVLLPARASFVTGLKACPKNPKLWISASRFEEKHDKRIKARSLLEKARMILPTDERIWAEAVQLEERSGAITAAKAILERGLQACPASGHLWSMAVWGEPRPTRKSRAETAMIKSARHPLVLCTIARLFWAERETLKARHWFEEATAGGSDIGDIWAWWLKFEREHGTEDQKLRVISSCTTAAPKHGYMWESISEDDGNVHQGAEFILELVSSMLDGSEPWLGD
ncbi:Pre-mRNA-processing factor 6 [Mycena sanguinolenta]|uniref:Pre-mRNA-processing factor 6 n=1 Tax=Mycena sanguinolenta TaxID=230812 RepID=A0A8H7D777_9AGAR|nr:Pre-mRNA-processing factor 6 [Mycena sanguinolenta]